MKIFFRLTIFLAVIAFSCGGVARGNTPQEPDWPYEIDMLLHGAIKRGLVSGGVVLIGDSRENIFCRAYGKLSGSPEAKPVELGTVFDIASLTKVVATAPAVLKLIEEERLSLEDPICKWFPEFKNKDKDDLLVLHLLTHTSGLRDISPSVKDSVQNIVEHAASSILKERPGNRFHYADINFILLGELVRRVSGMPLDFYTVAKIYIPLNMQDTRFNPKQWNINRCAATLNSDNSYLFGRVQDYTAFLLGGVAGHAGLFSTARDLSLFCRMILNKGTLDGQCVLMPNTVEQASRPYLVHDGNVLRGLGWDISSPFSCARGRAFSQVSFGHTGYSGCSIWIDPEADVFVVLLTSRLDYKRKKEFSELRSQLSTDAAYLVACRRAKHDFVRKFE